MNGFTLIKELSRNPLLAVLFILVTLASMFIDKDLWLIILTSVVKSQWLTFIVLSLVFISFIYVWSAFGEAFFDVNRRYRWEKTTENFEYFYGENAKEFLVSLSKPIGKNTIYGGIKHFDFKNNTLVLKFNENKLRGLLKKWKRICFIVGGINLAVLCVLSFVYLYHVTFGDIAQKVLWSQYIFKSFLVIPFTIFCVLRRDQYSTALALNEAVKNHKVVVVE